MLSSTGSHPARTAPTVLRWVFGALAPAWYVVTTFGALSLPNVAVVVVLGVLVALTVEPDDRDPHRGITATRRTLVLALPAVICFVPVTFGMDLLLGRIPIEPGHAVLATLATVCVALPRFAETRVFATPAMLGRRELIISVAALVAGVRAYQAGETVLAMVAFAVILPIVMVIRRIRLGAVSPAVSGAEPGRCRPETSGSSSFFSPRRPCPARCMSGVPTPPMQQRSSSRRSGSAWPSPPSSSPSLAGASPSRPTCWPCSARSSSSSSSSAPSAAPRDAVTIGVPLTGRWEAISAGRSALVNNHWTLTVQRDAIDIVMVVDGKTSRGDRSRLDSFLIYGQPLLAVADGRMTEVVDGHPDLPVGDTTWHAMAGNHVVLDIGGGHYVVYGHLKQGSLRVHAGEQVRRGQVLGEVGDSGNTGEPHVHLQVQNKPTFDVEDRSIRTYPILFDGATVSDVRRGDSVRPLA